MHEYVVRQLIHPFACRKNVKKQKKKKHRRPLTLIAAHRMLLRRGLFDAFRSPSQKHASAMCTLTCCHYANRVCIHLYLNMYIHNFASLQYAATNFPAYKMNTIFATIFSSILFLD